MYVVENNYPKHRKAKKLESCLEVKHDCTILDSDGKKLIKSIDPKTYKLKFG